MSYSDSMLLKQIVGQTLTYNRATTSWPLKACNTRSSNVPLLAWRTKWTASVIIFDKLQHKAVQSVVQHWKSFAASAWWHSTFLAGYQFLAIHTAGYEFLRKPEESTKYHQTLSLWVGFEHETIERLCFLKLHKCAPLAMQSSLPGRALIRVNFDPIQGLRPKIGSFVRLWYIVRRQLNQQCRTIGLL